MDDASLLRGALALYAPALVALAPAARRWQRAAGWLLVAAIALHTLALLQRWQRIGHGPFTTMHEVLSSNLWSLALVLAVAWWALRELRGVLVGAAPVLAVLAAWTFVADSGPGHFPPTYVAWLLYLHALLGKLFLGLLLVAVALGAWPWLGGERARPDARRAARLDELAHRFAAFAFVFDTLMLIVGAVWAQDAWGRYWAWDPLESWAFATWLALAAALHARATFRPKPAVHGLWLAGVFVIAFLTFFGVPFLSAEPHKGAF